jgi:hypothetical protein
MDRIKASEKVMDRREAIIGIVGGITVISAYVISSYNSIRTPVPKTWDTTRTIGERVAPIPDSWINTLERISIDSAELSKPEIDTLTRNMQPIDYNRVCKSNPGVAIPTTKYGMSLPDAINKIGKKTESNSGLTRIESTDWYTLVPEDAKKVFLSISKSNIPRKYWSGKDFESARKAKITYPGVFFPEERAQAWKDLVDVKDISALKEEMKPGTYFRGPDGKIIMPEHKDVSMKLNDLILVIEGPGHLPLRIYYSDFREVAEQNCIRYQKKIVPALEVKELLLYGNIDPKNKALIFHANNYSVCVPPWRQDKLKIIIDKNYENKYGVPTKLIGGEFFNKAAQIGGLYRIDAVPIGT